jgi:S1-C subfamily serine protease
VNPFDLIAIVLVAVAALAGFRSGAVPQVGGLIGAAVGVVAAIVALPLLTDLLGGLEPLARAVAVIGGLLFAVAVGEAVGSAIGHRLGAGLGEGLFGALDDVAGAAVGALQAVLIVWLVGGFLAISPFPRLAEMAQTATTLRVLGAVAPPPEVIAGSVADLLDDSGLPDLFVGLEPLPGPSVDRPTDPEARAIGALAERSTAKVSSTACGAILTGTGVVIAPGYLVTNAHVIAGSRTTRVAIAGQAHDAQAVLLDPALDVAVLRAPTLAAAPLRFAATDPTRGASGAALGYPDGAGLTIVPAAVSGRLVATGRDIYGEALVLRDILELRAEIEQGDSGGPFVLADGTVGGLVFAEARTDPEVGYALTATSVAIAVAPAIGRTEPVDTGPCLR